MNGTIICYNFNQKGHTANKCSTKTISNTHGERRINLAQEVDSQNDLETYGYLQRGESIMMRRTLLKMPIKLEPPQRKSISRTTCKSGGKICKVLVDSSST